MVAPCFCFSAAKQENNKNRRRFFAKEEGQK
jgi:hypothetical protein